MNVTRDVIYDLLPGYFAGELSADAKALVDEFFASDPECARMAERFRTLFAGRQTGIGDTPAGREKHVFERARSLRSARDRVLGMAVGFTAGALLALFAGALFPREVPVPMAFGFMRLPIALFAVASGVVALVAWLVWLVRVAGGRNASVQKHR